MNESKDTNDDIVRQPLRVGRVTTSFFVQQEAALRIHRQTLDRLRAQGYTVIEHSSLDAEVLPKRKAVEDAQAD